MQQSAINLAFALSTFTFASAAQAEGVWTLGAFVGGETGYYVGQHDEVGFGPFISFENEHFEISTSGGLAYHAIRSEGSNGTTTQVSLVLTPRWEPDFGDDPIFRGLKRDTAIEAGVRGRFENQLFFGEAAALADISGEHKGYEATAFAGVQYQLGGLNLEGGLGARYRSGDLNQYLFGVSASEANARRSAFKAKGTTTGFASITATYPLNDNVAVVGNLSFEDLGKMERSPLVDKGSNTSLALGLAYQF